MKGPCIVPNCPNRQHAKGYCRRHYGQMWRRGTISDTGRWPGRAEEGSVNLLPEDIRAAERELSRARETYAAVVGLAGRMYWRRKFEEAQEHVSVLREKAGETPAVQTGVGV